MDISNMKNMVVLKNLPSNIVDEAFVVLKANKKIKKLEKIEKSKFSDKEEKQNNKEYVLKEAEMLISNYISQIEENKKEALNKNNIKLNKYKRWAYITTTIAIVEAISIICI